MYTTQGIKQDLKDEFVGVSHGDLKRFKELLSKYPSLATVKASWGETPIEAAAQTAQREMVQLLLDAGAPLDICTAAVMGMHDKVREMLDADPSLKDATGAHGIPVIYYPVVGNYPEIAETLFEHGSDVNMGEGGNTALHGAALFGRIEMARWLLEHGANPNAGDYEGKTPLKIALSASNKELAELLEQYGGLEYVEPEPEPEAEIPVG